MAALRSDFRNKQLIFRIVYTVLLILALVFLAVSIILLIVYFSSAGLVVSYLETNPQPPTNHTPISLPDGLRATISHASSFVSNGIANGRTLTKRVLNEFIQQTDEMLALHVVFCAKGEGCIYLSRESAVNKTDFVMNSLVAEQWGSILGDTSGNGDSLLNASPPRNVLTALMKTCAYAEDQAIVGLFSAMKYENLVDMKKLVNSQKVQDGISSGRVYVLS
ncbi:hypothetical transcript [Echinococcus multilocularis]|uniref:Hypothetical transcript n=1 Tax=Echinococcus multilocularis TaxID=6211 RepID=A0A087VWF5_ECHMU|nr:hypothetical transcript [Echinococcus multilocularis]